jgi:hypothetical protein
MVGGKSCGPSLCFFFYSSLFGKERGVSCEVASVTHPLPLLFAKEGVKKDQSWFPLYSEGRGLGGELRMKG